MSRKRPNKKKIPSLLCSVKFYNHLPEVPFPPKFLPYQFDTERFVEYKSTSLEKEYKHKLLVDKDVGAPVDLLHEDAYPPLKDNLHPIDHDLIHSSLSRDQREEKLKESVSFLIKPDYIGADSRIYGKDSKGLENRVAVSAIQQEDINPVEQIEKTFEDVKKDPVRKTKKGTPLTIESSYEILPDRENWWMQLSGGEFDINPTGKRRGRNITEDMVMFGFLQGQANAEDIEDVHVSHFVPEEEYAERRVKRRKTGVDDVEEGELHEYVKQQEYKWKLHQVARLKEQYYLAFDDDKGVASYHPILSQTKLLRRRTNKRGQARTEPEFKVKEILPIRHRHYTDEEKAKMEEDNQKLFEDQPPEDDEEEPMEDNPDFDIDDAGEQPKEDVGGSDSE